MRKVYITCMGLCMIIFILASCKKDDLQFVIAGKDNKYWKRIPDKGRSQTFYYFDRHGKWFVFIKPYKSCAMSKYDGGDALLVEKWSVVRDSVLNIGGIEYRVTRISNERIIIENKYFKDTLVYMPFPPPIERRASE